MRKFLDMHSFVTDISQFRKWKRAFQELDAPIEAPADFCQS